MPKTKLYQEIVDLCSQYISPDLISGIESHSDKSCDIFSKYGFASIYILAPSEINFYCHLDSSGEEAKELLQGIIIITALLRERGKL